MYRIDNQMVLRAAVTSSLLRAHAQALKMLYKQQTIETETASKQSSWQAFASGKGTKRVAGSMKGVRKESIFRSPEGLDGKVGVVGSGQGMTDFDGKKKFKKV
jgi:survival of motor neuron-related-splicing factor 30